MAHLEVLRLMELDEVGDFLVMAANLMLIKARMLVPEQVDLGGGEDEIEDPRSELVLKLLEYKRYKEAALRLNDRRSARTRLYERGKDREPEAASEPAEAADTLRVEIWDLVEAFAKIVREVGAGKDIIPLTDEDRPVQEYMEEIVGRLHRTGVFHLDEIFQGVRDRIHVVSYFMAILELVRSGRVRARQKTSFGRILISLPESRPVAAPARPEAVPAPPSPASPDQAAVDGQNESIRPPAQPDPVKDPGRAARERR
jgi:segregation and condensation protein A